MAQNHLKKSNHMNQGDSKGIMLTAALRAEYISILCCVLCQRCAEISKKRDGEQKKQQQHTTTVNSTTICTSSFIYCDFEFRLFQ